MPAVSTSPQPKLQFFDANGVPLSGGKLYTYAAGTTTPLVSYTDSTGNTPNSNPVILDSRGEASVWLTGVQYKLALYTSANVLVWTVDGLNGPDTATLAALAANNGSSLVGFIQSNAYAVATTVQSKLRERISAFDFMTPEQIASVQARDMVEDVTVPLQNFFNACQGRKGYLPAGTYKKTAQIVMDPQYSYDIEGDGWSSENSEQGSIIRDTTSGNGLFIYYTLGNYPGGPPGGGFPNSDNRVRLAQFALRGPADIALSPGSQTIGIEGVNTIVATGTGIWMYWMQALMLDDVWIDGYPGDGIYGYRCFSTTFKNVWLIKNNRCGIHLFKTANSVALTGIKALANGRVPRPDVNFNILIDGAAGFENLGSVIDGNTDVSYAGQQGYRYNVKEATLTSVVVLTGTATINATGHAFSVGDKVAIFGATGGDAQINTIAPATVLTKTSNSFTVATTAANGTYSQDTLTVSPYCGGIGVANIQGIQITAYSEECSGPGVYIYDTVDGFTIHGGYWLQDKIYVENGAKGGSIRGCAFVGVESGVYLEDETSATVAENRYPTDPLRGTGSSYINNLPFLDNGSVILQGMTIGRGADLNINQRTPGPVTSTAIGVGTLRNANTSGGGTQGAQNTAVGYYALNANTAGYNNTAVGRHAGLATTTGYQNVAVGNRAMDTGTNIQDSVFVGNTAGSGMTSGGNDTYVGVASGVKATPAASDGNNTGIGSNALRVNGAQVYKWCTVVGAQENPMTAATGLVNYTGLGWNTYSFAADNKVRAGDANVTAAHVQVAWTATSDARLKKNIIDLDLGLDLVKALRPVSFKRINGDETEELGFIAQEIEQAIPRPLGLLAVDTDGTYMLRKDDLIAVLVKAVQELSARVDQLEAKA